ncbi:sulfur carrier protein [Gracilibacillus ureilyticus]|uniref:Sulfur carrier protein n=1 Tax=Gracilibacillus ureilyticus TaxID=531814 RepID=A0A1H9SL26_9BACI|nr:sulfur carrier protein ThiS [Gracilibacillus ureilyticus]SER85608.1 sulfur carrier protein [Gracilibacillus ureilyticus]
MKLIINGEDLELNEDVKNIEELITVLGLTDKSLIVEHNQSILKKQEHSVTAVTDGDQLEIVHFVGGG